MNCTRCEQPITGVVTEFKVRQTSPHTKELEPLVNHALCFTCAQNVFNAFEMPSFTMPKTVTGYPAVSDPGVTFPPWMDNIKVGDYSHIFKAPEPPSSTLDDLMRDVTRKLLDQKNTYLEQWLVENHANPETHQRVTIGSDLENGEITFLVPKLELNSIGGIVGCMVKYPWIAIRTEWNQGSVRLIVEKNTDV